MTASLFWILNMKMTLNIVGADASVRPKQNMYIVKVRKFIETYFWVCYNENRY